MNATHKDTEENVKLYKRDIEKNQSGAKFAFDKAGLWNIDILVDEEEYTSLVIEAKSKK